ncbi:FAD-binding domain-containing protein [Mycena polygramma]|nr:FAD-binding domain-containing protein [Mycena polygramma]
MLLGLILTSVASLATALAPEANATSDAQLSPAASASLACGAIRLALGSSIVESSGAEYNTTARNTWNLFNSLDSPTCVVYPRTASHVQVAMASIYKLGSHYAVQAGAHSGMVGWNSISDGVLISFAHMTNASYNPSTDTVTVQPGVHWGQAADAIEAQGVSVIGGRAADVGTGLLLGGGISFTSPLFGWSADALKEMDVVLVSGKLVTATATNAYSDLFRALKGGANRFGIVTRYEIYAAHTGTKDDKRWFGGMIVYPGSSTGALSNASARYIREVTDPKAGFIAIMNTENLSAVDTNTVYVFYQGASLPDDIFGSFLSIPSTSQSLSPLSYHDISFLIPGNERGNGQQFGASSWVGDEATFLAGYNHLVNFTRTFDNQLVSSSLIISPIPQSQWKSGTARGHGATNAIGDPGVSYAAINFYPVYPAGLTTIPKDVNAGFQLLLKQTPPSPGLPLYVNECDASQDVFATYPDFATLKKTYAKYDPLRFNVGHTAGPKGL